MEVKFGKISNRLKLLFMGDPFLEDTSRLPGIETPINWIYHSAMNHQNQTESKGSSQSANEQLSVIFALLGVGGIMGACSSSFMTLLLGLPWPIFICAVVQGLLGLFSLLCFLKRSKKELSWNLLFAVIMLFLVNGAFAVFIFVQFVNNR